MHLINLIGGSGSGKGFLAKHIIDLIGEERISTIPMDMYYYPAERWPDWVYADIDGQRLKNFDTPEALEIDLLVEHLTRLKTGESVQIPHYDFGNNPSGEPQRTPWETIHPKDFLILDGIFGLVDERIRELTDVSIFVDVSPLNRMARRFMRDFGYGQTRAYIGSGLGDTIKFYTEYVERGYQDYVEKYKEYADLVVNNDVWISQTPPWEGGQGGLPKMVDITVNYLKGKFDL